MIRNILILLVIFILHFPQLVTGQSLVPEKSPKTDSIRSKDFKPEILTNGFIDIINNGQVNASARFIRLSIGEPGKIAIPLSVYGGVSANNFQSNGNQASLKNNDHLVNNYINPLSGLINVSIDAVVFRKRDKGCLQ